MEHRFTGEETVDTDSVETSDQLVVNPRLHTVRPPEFMERNVRSHELVVDPTVRPVRISTGSHHGFERGVEAHFVATETAAQ